MKKINFALGIETSCDETAAAVVCDIGTGIERIKSNVIYSQFAEHSAYGGVVPEIAARAHNEVLLTVVKRALDNAGVCLKDLQFIAATCGPGLVGGLLVGSLAAKTMAMASNKPFVAVNHLEGHALVCRLSNMVDFPYLLLLASGGHCQFWEVYEVGQYRMLGETLDDSAGEVFDKIAFLLKLPGHGGAAVEEAAKLGNENRFPFSIPLKDRSGCDLSFSGLKTSFRILIQHNSPISDFDKMDFAASLQKAIADTLYFRSKNALKMASEKIKESKKFVVAGGVAANNLIRKKLKGLCDESGFSFLVPPIELCTDNAAMIAWAGWERYSKSGESELSFPVYPQWRLDSANLKLKDDF